MMYKDMNENNKYSDLTYLPFRLLYLAGQDFFGNRTIWTVLDTFIVAGCVVLCLTEPLLHFQGPETLAGALEVAGPSHQWLTKMLIYKFYRKTFVDLVTSQNKFWTLNHEGPKLEKHLIKIFIIVQKGFQIFLLCSSVAETLMALRPLLMLIVSNSPRELPVMVYYFIDLNQSPYYEIFYIIHITYLYLICTFVVGFDGLFLALCTNAAGQLVLLKHAMSRLEPKTARQKIKIYVEHHVFILGFIKKLRTIFSFLLLNQFLSSMLCVCMAIYLTTSQGMTDYVFIARCGLFAAAGVIQIFIYCLTGTQIKAQMDSVSEAIYVSKWWESDQKDLRLAVLMITQQAQIAKSFKAGGMIDLDLQNFIAILRMSFSFFTLMQSPNAQKN